MQRQLKRKSKLKNGVYHLCSLFFLSLFQLLFFFILPFLPPWNKRLCIIHFMLFLLL